MSVGVSIDASDAVCWITISRPEAANALRIEDLTAIADTLREIDDATRAVVFTGAGDRHFSAGMHLDTFRGCTAVTARRKISIVADTLRAVRLCPVPTVALLNGVCLGAAFELALSCDIRIAHWGVKVGLPEVKLGIPSVADAALLPRFIGLSMAREMILTGDLYSLSELGYGLANRLVSQGQLRSELDLMLTALMRPSRQVIRAQKFLFERWLDSGISASVASSVDCFGDLFADRSVLDSIETYAKKIVG